MTEPLVVNAHVIEGHNDHSGGALCGECSRRVATQYCSTCVLAYCDFCALEVHKSNVMKHHRLERNDNGVGSPPLDQKMDRVSSPHHHQQQHGVAVGAHQQVNTTKAYAHLQESPPAAHLIPYPGENKFHSGFCECGLTTCCMSKLCACVVIAHIRAKLAAIAGRDSAAEFNGAISTWFLLLILTVWFAGPSFVGIWFIVSAITLRRRVRMLLNIPGNYCSDFCLGWCCPCCTLAQLVETLWSNPNEQPGCNFSNTAAEVV